MRRALSLIDIDFRKESNSNLKYYLVADNQVIAEIKIKNGKKVFTKSKTIQIIQDTLYTKWYKTILNPWMEKPEENSKYVYNCIDIKKKKSIGNITFDRGYTHFTSTVSPPYYWISSDLYPINIQIEKDADVDADIIPNYSEMLPSPSPTNTDRESHLLHSYDDCIETILRIST